MSDPKRERANDAEENTPERRRAMVRELDALRQELTRLKAHLDEHSEEAMDALREKLATSCLILENLRDMVIILDDDGRPLRVVGNSMGTLGYTSQELAGLTTDELLARTVVPEDLSRAKAAFDRARRSSRSEICRIEILDSAGERRATEMSWLALRDERGELLGVQLNVRDIDERVQTEQFVQSLNAAAEAVQEAPLSVENVVDVAMDQLQALNLYALLAIRGDVVHKEGADCYRTVRVTGERRVLQLIQEIIGLAWEEIVFAGGGPLPAPDAWGDRRSLRFRIDRDFWSKVLDDQLLARKLAQIVEPLEVAVVPMITEQELTGLLAIARRTLSDQVVPALQAFGNHLTAAIANARLVENLAESEARYRAIYEATQEGLLMVAPDGSIDDASPAAEQIFGYSQEQLVGRSLSDLIEPEEHRSAAALDERLGQRQALQIETVGLRCDGSRFPAEMQYARLGDGIPYRLIVINDISERLRTRETLVQTEKLRALGSMSAGIAHDFNNILAGIQANAELALRSLQAGELALEGYLRTILDGSQQAAETVRCLQSLYRQSDDTSDFQHVQVDCLVESVLKLTQPRWKDQAQARGVTIHVRRELGSPPVVAGNPGELRRVISNLVINAIEAMPDGGVLTVKTGEEDGSVYIAVQDTGQGMDKETSEQLFQPFFTTKRSSGLGLTISHTIIERHQGSISVESELGSGSTFTVSLPAHPAEVDGAAEQTAPASYETVPAQPELNRSLNLLVVDDDAIVRNVLARMLQREGHAVQAVGSSVQALALLEKQSFDLMITDLGMPNMSGDKLVDMAHKIVPDMPIVLTTGWAETFTPDRQRELGVDALLAKPFTMQAVLAMMEEALGG